MPRSSRQERSGESRWITLADGRRLHARCWPGRGKPLVLLHGLLDSAAGWDGVCASVERPCVAFDLPGFGSSDLPSEPLVAAYASDVAAGIRRLGLRDFVLVGHSFGGAVAAAVAEAMPESTAALMLVAPAGFGRIRLAEATSLPGMRSLTKSVLGLALGNGHAVRLAYRLMVAGGARPVEGVVERVTSRGAALVPAAIAATRAIIAAGLSADAFHMRTLGFAGPVTAVWGSEDLLVPPSHARGVRRAAPHARIHIWDGMAHHVQQERRDDLTALIHLAETPWMAADERATRARPAAAVVATARAAA